MGWQFWIQHSPSFAQKKLARVSSAEIICPFFYRPDKGCDFKIQYRCQKSHKNTHMTYNMYHSLKLPSTIFHSRIFLLRLLPTKTLLSFLVFNQCFCPLCSSNRICLQYFLAPTGLYYLGFLFTVSHLQPWLHWKIFLYIYQENALHESHSGYTNSNNPAGWLSLRIVTMLFTTMHFHTADTEWESLLCIYYTPNICTHL